MRKKQAAREKADAVAKPAAAKENIEALLKVEPLAVEMGLGLVKYVGGGQESPLIKRIARHPQTDRQAIWDSCSGRCAWSTTLRSKRTNM